MKKLTKKGLTNFLKKLSGEPGEFGEGFWVVSGKEGKVYSEYSGGKYYVNLDGSSLYDLLNYGDYNPVADKCSWYTVDKLNEYLGERGCYYEMGNAWNFSVFEK